jgi:uncharacterized protein YlxW (UPF0749 family)
MSQKLNVEERLGILEKLLLIPPSTKNTSSNDPDPELKTTPQIRDIEDQIESLEYKYDSSEAEIADLSDSIDSLSNGDASAEEITRQIKHHLRIYLRNALGLEVSFDDHR